MAEFSYTTVPGKIPKLLDKIREVGIPPKATVQWLRSIGLTSSNERTLLGVLKSVGLVDQSGVPTPIWNQFRGAGHKRVLGDAIRKGYAELFAVYSDAWKRNQTDLENVISTSSTGGRQVVSKTVSTFKALAAAAEFPESDQGTDLHVSVGQLHPPTAARPPEVARPSSAGDPTVHIDLQIHISPEATSDQIDQVFASIAKHLYAPKGA